MIEPDPLKRIQHRLLQGRMTSNEEACELLRPVCAALGKLGITAVEVSYSGYGDSGAIDEFEVEPDVAMPDDLRSLVEYWVMAVLPSGFEINEGGQGYVTIDVAASRAHIDHGENQVVKHSFEIE